ncbi:MAG: acyl-CoA dehydrogenase [Sphingorhabdus sp.]
MELNLTDDQLLIRESAARFVSDRGRPEAGAVGFDRALWGQMADMGWLSAGIGEEFGGFGGPVEIALIAEELGRGSSAGEYLGAAVLGPQLLIASGDAEARDRLLSGIVAGETLLAAAISEPDAAGNLASVSTRANSSGAAFRLDGTKTLVLAGDVADLFIVSARTSGDSGAEPGISLFLVHADATGVSVQPTPLVDGSSAATVVFENAEGQLLGIDGEGFAALTAMAEQAIAAIAAETVGMMEAVAEITAEYFRSRKQFGMLLGQFQVLQHRLADMAIDAEMGRATLLVALATFDLTDPRIRALRFAGTKAAAGEALRRVTEAGVQAHGGMGMTQEYPVGRYLQRMVVLDAILGAPAVHLALCAKTLAEEQA